jgi:hypothetical protein
MLGSKRTNDSNRSSKRAAHEIFGSISRTRHNPWDYGRREPAFPTRGANFQADGARTRNAESFLFAGDQEAATRAAREPGGLARGHVTDPSAKEGMLQGIVSEHQVAGGSVHDPAVISATARTAPIASVGWRILQSISG